jgi:hypothetical protein
MYKPAAESNFTDEYGKLTNMLLLIATVSTWAVSTEGTEWLIAVQLVGVRVSGQKLFFLPVGL